jgi:hypothetical protein
MQSAHNHFQSNIGRARDLQALYVTLSVTTTGALDLSDILRASIVLAVSALDHFVHEVTRIGMLEIYGSTRPKTEAFGRFSVTMENVLLCVAMPSSLQWLDDEVRKQHGWLSFQTADKVADAIRLICAKKLWEEVGGRLGIDARSAKNRLNLIIDRRNKIAHEADMDPSAPGARWPIDELLVQDAIDTLVQLASAIFDVVTTP